MCTEHVHAVSAQIGQGSSIGPDLRTERLNRQQECVEVMHVIDFRGLGEPGHFGGTVALVQMPCLYSARFTV